MQRRIEEATSQGQSRFKPNASDDETPFLMEDIQASEHVIPNMHLSDLTPRPLSVRGRRFCFALIGIARVISPVTRPTGIEVCAVGLYRYIEVRSDIPR